MYSASSEETLKLTKVHTLPNNASEMFWGICLINWCATDKESQYFLASDNISLKVSVAKF
jgi:hypothetical protein